ncbi:MAG: LLM class flavin-dependent oxidoreductase [Chloroflexota bacterium]
MQFGLMMRSGEYLCPGAGRIVPWTELRDIARVAEDVGFDGLFAPDHLLFRDWPGKVPEGETRGLWEVWTVLSALAEATKRVTIGPFVMAMGFRNPALLAKMADTLDEVSGGRLILGLGSGRAEPEHTAFGYPFDHIYSRFDEALQVMVPLLRTGHVDFEGRYYQMRDCELRPRGPRGGNIPIWIGARGPRMLRLVAKYSDGYNTLTHVDASEVSAPFAQLRDACQDVGRDFSSMYLTAGANLMLPGSEHDPGGLPESYIGGSDDEIVERLKGFEAAGVQQMTFFLSPWSAKGVEGFGRVIERMGS